MNTQMGRALVVLAGMTVSGFLATWKTSGSLVAGFVFAASFLWVVVACIALAAWVAGGAP